MSVVRGSPVEFRAFHSPLLQEDLGSETKTSSLFLIFPLFLMVVEGRSLNHRYLSVHVIGSQSTETFPEHQAVGADYPLSPRYS